MIFSRLAAGETAAALGLTWHYDRDTEPFKSVMTSEAPDYPVDGLRELSGLGE